MLQVRYDHHGATAELPGPRSARAGLLVAIWMAACASPLSLLLAAGGRELSPSDPAAWLALGGLLLCATIGAGGLWAGAGGLLGRRTVRLTPEALVLEEEHPLRRGRSRRWPLWGARSRVSLCGGGSYVVRFLPEGGDPVEIPFDDLPPAVRLGALLDGAIARAPGPEERLPVPRALERLRRG